MLQDMKRTERRLQEDGKVRFHRIEGPDRADEVFDRILRIERSSWKQIFRNRRGMKHDTGLLKLWDGAQRASKEIPGFRWRVWFLELSNRMVAYALFFRYKDTEFAAKTSYDEEFAKCGVGIYLMNVAIREIFEEAQAKMIDFVSDAAFTRTWTYSRTRRINFLITSRKGVPRIIASCLWHWALGPKLHSVWGLGERFPSIFSRLNPLYELGELW